VKIREERKRNEEKEEENELHIPIFRNEVHQTIILGV